MKKKSPVTTILIVLGCFLTVVLAVLALSPFFQKVFTVEVAKMQEPEEKPDPVLKAPEEVPVTVYYMMEDNSKKISGIYIEVFPLGEDTVLYVEVPVDTRVNLSEDLYKSLQAYAPELPQYLKLSNMAEGFSAEYGLTGCNRILSEVIGYSFAEYVRTDENAMTQWLALLNGDKTDTGFFYAYDMWLKKTDSSRTSGERWMLYESRQQIKEVITEQAPGNREKDGYLLYGKQTKERLEEAVLRRNVKKEQE